MNYYERHLGDYATDAGHLSMLEHGAYTLLLDRFYRTEAPIPADQAHRVCRARSEEERQAVDAVLAEFWTLTDDGWINRRAVDEIERARRKIEAARTNGQRGGRPKKNQEATQEKPTGFSLGSDQLTQAKAHQTPDTIDNPLPPAGEPAEPASMGQSIPCPYAEIVEAYHAALPELPRAKLMTDARQRAIRKRWGWVLSSRKPDGSRRAEDRGQALAWFAAFFARVRDNDFLMGRTARGPGHEGWECDLDFLMTDRGLKQVVEKTQTRDAA